MAGKKPLIISGTLAVLAAAFFFSRKQTDIVESPPILPQTVAATPPPEQNPATSAVVVTQMAAPVVLTSKDKKKIATLHEIFHARNDNDPRMDTELRELSPALRAELRNEYSQTEHEKLNQRGTIVFLLSRDAKPEDAAFLASVAEEPACKSLANCSTLAPSTGEADADLGNDVTLQYPQLVAIRGLAKYLEHASPEEKKRLVDSLRNAAKSEGSKIAQAAQDLLAAGARSDSGTQPVSNFR